MKILQLEHSLESKLEVERLAEKLNLDIVYDKEHIEKGELILIYDEKGLALSKDNMMMHGDYTQAEKRLKVAGKKSELLLRAAKMKSESTTRIAFDATAGLGEDSLLLAYMGYTVYLFEQNSIIAELLKDTLKRAKQIPELEHIVNRMHLVEGNSIEKMPTSMQKPDVIYLDPMFPARTKNSLVKKKFQLIHDLEQPCMEEKELLDAAIKSNPSKIIIKRPLKAPLLGEMKPSYALEGKGIRYDCILLHE